MTVVKENLTSKLKAYSAHNILNGWIDISKEIFDFDYEWTMDIFLLDHNSHKIEQFSLRFFHSWTSEVSWKKFKSQFSFFVIKTYIWKGTSTQQLITMYVLCCLVRKGLHNCLHCIWFWTCDTIFRDHSKCSKSWGK